MEQVTQELLRKAAIEALSSREDRAAMELLALLHGRQSHSTVQQTTHTLSAAQPISEGPPHDCHYWIKFIRENFIPFMTSNGRLRFTSHELFSWIENCSRAELTTGDVQRQVDGKAVWRDIASNALGNLKRQGIIYAEFRGKEYEIQGHYQLPFAVREVTSQQERPE